MQIYTALISPDLAWQSILVGFANILGSLELDLEPLGANLITVHCLDCRVCRLVCCEGDKSCLKDLVLKCLLLIYVALPKHLDRLVCLSMNTLAETMVPNGWNVWLRSESVNSWR